MGAHGAYGIWNGGGSAQGGDEDIALTERNQLITEELPQVYFIAARIHERLPASVQMEDLVSAGVVGLLEAYQSFDKARNAQFKTFARFRIRGAILDSLRTLDWGSRGMRRKARDIAETKTKLESALGRVPTREEIAYDMKISLEELDTAMTQIDGLHVVGQQAATAGEMGEPLDLIESSPSHEPNPFDLYLRGEQKQQLTRAVAALNEREQLILSLYYKEELTMKEVAEVIGVALSRVSQIHNAAIAKLRVAMRPQQQAPLPGVRNRIAASAAVAAGMR